jgi:hypothetical protein
VGLDLQGPPPQPEPERSEAEARAEHTLEGFGWTVAVNSGAPLGERLQASKRRVAGNPFAGVDVVRGGSVEQLAERVLEFELARYESNHSKGNSGL